MFLRILQLQSLFVFHWFWPFFVDISFYRSPSRFPFSYFLSNFFSKIIDSVFRMSVEIIVSLNCKFQNQWIFNYCFIDFSFEAMNKIKAMPLGVGSFAALLLFVALCVDKIGQFRMNYNRVSGTGRKNSEKKRKQPAFFFFFFS